MKIRNFESYLKKKIVKKCEHKGLKRFVGIYTPRMAHQKSSIDFIAIKYSQARKTINGSESLHFTHVAPIFNIPMRNINNERSRCAQTSLSAAVQSLELEHMETSLWSYFLPPLPLFLLLFFYFFMKARFGCEVRVAALQAISLIHSHW